VQISSRNRIAFGVRAPASTLRLRTTAEVSGMTVRAGLLMIAIGSVIARLAGDPVSADGLAVIYLFSATLHFHRSTRLSEARTIVRS
jgi:hypothetical protein